MFTAVRSIDCDIVKLADVPKQPTCFQTPSAQSMLTISYEKQPGGKTKQKFKIVSCQVGQELTI